VKLPSAVAAALTLASCGYVGEPMYPLLNIPTPVKDLAAVQRGAVIVYQFTQPALTTEGKAAKVGELEIRAAAAQGAFDLGNWYSRSVPIQAKPDASGHVRSEIPAGPWIGKDLILGVKVFGANHRDAGWSNFATVTVIDPLPKPANVEAQAVAEGVRVTWQGPAGQYRVLRRAESGKDFALVATVDAPEWLDAAAEYGKQYTYLIQAVKKAGVSEAESDLSDPREITPIDKFPPAVPTGLNAIIAADHIELVWDRNTEPDFALYRLYRGVAGGALEKLADIPDTPSYSDTKVESGKQYRYALSAVDRLNNESNQSAAVEISAP